MRKAWLRRKKINDMMHQVQYYLFDGRQFYHSFFLPELFPAVTGLRWKLWKSSTTILFGAAASGSIVCVLPIAPAVAGRFIGVTRGSGSFTDTLLEIFGLLSYSFSIRCTSSSLCTCSSTGSLFPVDLNKWLAIIMSSSSSNNDRYTVMDHCVVRGNLLVGIYYEIRERGITCEKEFASSWEITDNHHRFEWYRKNTIQ